MRPDLKLISHWIDPGSRVLDLGCGNGMLLTHLQQQRQVSGYGLEIDPENCTQCLSAGLNVIQWDLNEGLGDFDNDSFDYVIMTHTLQAVKKPLNLLNEMLRVGKQVIVTFPNLAFWQFRLKLIFSGTMPLSRALPHTWYESPNIHLCTVKDFETACRDHGIQVTQRAFVDYTHQAGKRLFPNWFGEIAIYRLASRNKIATATA
ncbi:MAG: methionine biosynthesis protein MetW [Gammaproteobacteria bacterium]|nr:methionine biosynthesis protein MetW [Gammaproteobacteria bacterium]MDH5802127.1 methionine biosynthesis protein MetW [Gammaproteobacteria bacterium]